MIGMGTRPETRFLALFFLGLGLATLGCDSGGTESVSTSPDATGDTTGKDSASLEILADSDVSDLANPELHGTSAEEGPGEVFAAPERPYPARSIRLQLPTQPEGFPAEFVLDVVARDLPKVAGIALRIEWDNEDVEFDKAVFKPVFGQEGKEAVYRVALVRERSLALGIAHLGYKGEHALEGDVVLAELHFKVPADHAWKAHFDLYEPRCLVLTRKLEPVEVSYISLQAGRM